MKKLLLVTTIPDTFNYILKGQPKYLASSFQVFIASDDQLLLKQFAELEEVIAFPVPMKRGIAPIHDLRSVWKMFCLLRQLKPDLVHSYTPKAALICSLAGFFARVPIRIHTFTGLLFPTATGAKRLLLKSIDALVCILNTHVVPEGKGVLQELKTITKKTMQVIGYGNIAGVDLHHFSPEAAGLDKQVFDLRQRYQLQDVRTYCFVGRINKDKGLAELCMAFQTVAMNTSCKLLIVGSVDNENPVDDYTLNLILHHPDIIYLGFQDDVRPAILAADVFVLPSYREGFPNVVLQAGALAKPCLVTDVPGSNEIVTTGLNGWVIPAKDVDELTKQLLIIQKLEKNVIVSMGIVGRECIAEKFDRDFYLLELIKYYKRVTDETHF